MTTTFTATFATMDEFIIRAIIGGILVAVISAPLGCLVVWQRMSYFGAALSHAALLGVALGLLLGLPIKLAILLICAVLALLLFLAQRMGSLGSDTILGILAHASLAIGLIVISLMPAVRIDLMAYLFGDVLTISWNDIVWIGLTLAFVFALLTKIWQAMLSLIVDGDLATVDGHHRDKLQMLYLLSLSAVVAVAMQVVGLLLIVSLLIIPAATARPFSRTPEQMVWGAIMAGISSVLIGIWMSLSWDLPAGPSIVASASILFVFSASLSGLLNSRA